MPHTRQNILRYVQYVQCRPGRTVEDAEDTRLECDCKYGPGSRVQNLVYKVRDPESKVRKTGSGVLAQGGLKSQSLGLHLGTAGLTLIAPYFVQ
jgi:hypothetical protein